MPDADTLAAAPPRDDGTPIVDDIVGQAVAWYVRMASGAPSADDRATLSRWLAEDTDHARAWQRLQDIGQQLQGTRTHLSPPVARSTLGRTAAPRPARRRALKALAWTGAGGAALFMARDHAPWREEWAAARADERAATGERRSLVLADGTQLMLNTATRLDVRFTPRERRVVLHGGEILVATARDATGRPFVVETPEGTLVPIGTRFTVRRDDTPATHLAVLEGAVDVRPDHGPATRVAAGRQVAFTRDGTGPVGPRDDAASAWTDGVLVAAGIPLGTFLAELGRYRTGRLRCDPEVARLRITGTWPLDGPDPTEHILASLERQLPVRVQRLTRYWVTVHAR